MGERFTFSQKLVGALGAVVAIAVALAVVAVYALRDVVARKDEVIDVSAQRMVDTERLNALLLRKGAEARAYLMTGEPAYAENMREARSQFQAVVRTLRNEVQTEEGRQLLEQIDSAEQEHQRVVDVLLAARTPEAHLDVLGVRLEREVRPARQRLEELVARFIAREDRLLRDQRTASTEAAARAIRLLIALTVAGVVLAAVLAILLARSLSRRISGAVQHVQSSSAELQASAGQQATGAKEQATAMAEITTTISELLATSRQIAESAQRVAAVAAETAGAARAGDATVRMGQESMGSIRRQTDLIVNHMLELGRKSQQIGGIVEIIDELAEQTNILAINATIEAAGAGEAGRRFAVVAEEIRKLADRVGGSTKDVRTLIEEVRAAVNTTVMATESGSKTVDAGARQFGDVAASFGHIAGLVATTTEVAREIELSTKQQTTAVEQVNVAISNVAQATREAEASSGQSLQTASQLAEMSRDLARLVQPKVAA
jgi:methyl-accepting chemotaxis protein